MSTLVVSTALAAGLGTGLRDLPLPRRGVRPGLQCCCQLAAVGVPIARRFTRDSFGWLADDLFSNESRVAGGGKRMQQGIMSQADARTCAHRALASP